MFAVRLKVGTTRYATDEDGQILFLRRDTFRCRILRPYHVYIWMISYIKWLASSERRYLVGLARGSPYKLSGDWIDLARFRGDATACLAEFARIVDEGIDPTSLEGSQGWLPAGALRPPSKSGAPWALLIIMVLTLGWVVAGLLHSRTLPTVCVELPEGQQCARCGTRDLTAILVQLSPEESKSARQQCPP